MLCFSVNVDRMYFSSHSLQSSHDLSVMHANGTLIADNFFWPYRDTSVPDIPSRPTSNTCQLSRSRYLILMSFPPRSHIPPNEHRPTVYPYGFSRHPLLPS